MRTPTWDILIVSLEHRDKKLRRLLDALKPQIVPGVGVLIYRDNLEECIGTKRQRLLEASTADYVNFCDDDDMVTPDYVERIMEALKKRPDYVGFEQILTEDGRRLKRVFHSLRYDHWYETPDGYYRGITHSNPIRRELALLARYDTTEGAGEDHAWSIAMTATGEVKTEVYLDKPVHIILRACRDNFWTPREPLTVHPPKPRHRFVKYVTA